MTQYHKNPAILSYLPTQNQALIHNGTHYENSNINTSIVNLPILGSVTNRTLQDSHNNLLSSGIISGCLISDAGSGNINISSGELYIRNGSNRTDPIFRVDSYIGLPDDQVSIITIKWNGSNLIINRYDNPLDQYNDEIQLGLCYRSGPTVLPNNNYRVIANDYGNRFTSRIFDCHLYSPKNPPNITVDSNEYIDIPSSTWWTGLNSFNIPGYNSGTVPFGYYYKNVSNVWIGDIYPAIPHFWIDTGVKTAENGGKWLVFWVYLLPFDIGSVSIMYDQGNLKYDSITHAQTSTKPTDVLPRMRYNSNTGSAYYY